MSPNDTKSKNSELYIHKSKVKPIRPPLLSPIWPPPHLLPTPHLANVPVCSHRQYYWLFDHQFGKVHCNVIAVNPCWQLKLKAIPLRVHHIIPSNERTSWDCCNVHTWMQTLDFCCLHASLCIYHWVAVIIKFKVITHAFVFNRLLSPILSRHLCPVLACICIYVPCTSAIHQQNAPEVRPRLQKQMWHTLRHLGHWDLRRLKRQKAQYSEFSTRHSTGKFIGFMLEQLEYLCSNCSSSSLLLSSCQSWCCLQPAHKPIPNKFQLINCLANHGHVSNHVSTQENGHVYRKHVQFSK